MPKVPHLLGRALGLWLHLLKYDNTVTQHSGLAWTRPCEPGPGKARRGDSDSGPALHSPGVLPTPLSATPGLCLKAQLHLRTKLPYT